jgi:sec-independent protein translocase protein TatC
VDAAGLKRYRKHAILIIVILGGVLTPPDPFTQILLAGILFALFESGRFLVARTEKKRQP